MRVCLFVVCLLLHVQAAGAQDITAPRFGVASNFGQGMPPGLLQRALDLGFSNFRDAVYWANIETAPGRYDFATPMTTYPDLIAAAGATMSLTVNNGHPAYENGATPLDAPAVAAFGRAVGATVARFPAITEVEIGNEFNSVNFVSGPLKSAGLAARAKAYAALAGSVVDHVKTPGITFIGGGVHSIPTGYLARVLDAGAFRGVDHLAVHPYDTPWPHLGQQLSVLRRAPAFAQMPVQVTEFGTQSPREAVDLLYRAYCDMALAGVERAVWYPLNARGDGYVPLIEPDLSLTDVGRAALFVQNTIAGKPVRPINAGRYTFGCVFGEQIAVIWGHPQSVTVETDAVEVLQTPTRNAGAVHSLAETQVLVLRATSDAPIETLLTFGGYNVLADTWYDFHYPAASSKAAPFTFLAQSPSATQPLITMPGQDRGGVPWTPYLGLKETKDLRVLPRSVLPAGTATAPQRVILRHRVPQDHTVDVDISLAAAERSRDGIDMAFHLNGVPLLSQRGLRRFETRLPQLELLKGDQLDLIIGPGATAAGDVTRYRVILRASD
ncbi:MAG: hypothetical protein HRU30_20365 [Rhodobacteraceae bacterium]|nr:hypothetical protein [Paracoccaceae bacterium]